MSSVSVIDAKYRKATECHCCNKKLPLERKLKKRPHFRAGELLYPEFGQCRLCGSKCCVQCLTLDSICDDCLLSMENDDAYSPHLTPRENTEPSTEASSRPS